MNDGSITTYVLRFIANVKLKKRGCPTELSVEEAANAETFWYRYIQKEIFSDEYEILKWVRSLQRNSPLLKPDLYFEKNSGTLRVGGSGVSPLDELSSLLGQTHKYV